MRARDFLGPDGELARALSGYELREGQLEMADAVEAALEDGSSLLCEAGTGTGKTLAYLVPAILSGRKVVVSTATKALQEQVFTKDIPMLIKTFGRTMDANAAMVKGLSNYLCRRRFEETRTSPEASLTNRRSLPLLELWARETETGDLAELATLAEGDPIFQQVSSSSETRIGSTCKFYADCFVTRMKRDAEQARLVIVNHHLFFADLAVKLASARRGFAGAGALPPYDAVIFDEAHELEDIATSFFGTRVSTARVDSMLRDADRAFVAANLADAVLGKGEGTALTAIVREGANAFFDRLAKLGRGEGDGGNRVMLGRDTFSGELLGAMHTLDSMLEALAGYADSNAVDEAVKLVGQRAASLRDDIATIADPATNHVTWLEVRARSVAIGSSPVDVGRMFREQVFDRIGSVVLTSATLTSASASGAPSFTFLKRRLGLADPDAPVLTPVHELGVASPFDYGASALLYTPRDLPDANDTYFVARAADRIAELVGVTGGGAFVLCTSVRAMRAFAAELRRRVSNKLLVQGDAPKGRLLGQFRALEHAVLVATMSFWEGVDVPGHALRLVVIDRIPFAVPTDPVVAARCKALEAEGQNPFTAYSVPEAAITLKQGFGRLIRSKTDRGIVAILDKRVVTRGYGTALLSSLPPARRTDRLDEVAAFWQNARSETA